MGISRVLPCTELNINNEKTYYINHKPPEFYAKARTTFESCFPTQIVKFCEGAIQKCACVSNTYIPSISV